MGSARGPSTRSESPSTSTATVPTPPPVGRARSTSTTRRCSDHTQGIVDDELHDYWTQLMDQCGAMLFGRNTYELMEGAWPAVARDEKAPRAMREWAQKLEAKAKYVVSGTRSDFPWQNTIKVKGDLRE